MKITLCGSARFREAWEDWNMALTCAGHQVYAMGGFARVESDKGKDDNVTISNETKMLVDLVHLAKIEDSEAILVLNVNGYIGDSTKREIAWARLRGKRVMWLYNSVTGQGFLDETIWTLYAMDGRTMAAAAGGGTLAKYRK